jgi:ABC-type glycerol-3-phosphate transport system permease component
VFVDTGKYGISYPIRNWTQYNMGMFAALGGEVFDDDGMPVLFEGDNRARSSRSSSTTATVYEMAWRRPPRPPPTTSSRCRRSTPATWPPSWATTTPCCASSGPTCRRARSANWRAVPLPYPDGAAAGRYVAGGWVIALVANAADPARRPPRPPGSSTSPASRPARRQQGRRLGAHPPRRDRADAYYADDPFMVTTLAALNAGGYVVPFDPLFPVVVTALNQAIAEVVTGQATVAAGPRRRPRPTSCASTRRGRHGALASRPARREPFIATHPGAPPPRRPRTRRRPRKDAMRPSPIPPRRAARAKARRRRHLRRFVAGPGPGCCPPSAMLALFRAYPMGHQAWLSLTDMRIATIGQARFVGLDNYRFIFTDPGFLSSLTFTFVFTIGSVGLSFLLGFALALLLDRPLRGRSVYRTAILTSWVISSLIVGYMWQMLLNESSAGVVNGMLRSIGLPAVTWFSDPTIARIVGHPRRHLALERLHHGVHARRAADHPARARRGGHDRRRQRLAAPAARRPAAALGPHHDRAHLHDHRHLQRLRADRLAHRRRPRARHHDRRLPDVPHGLRRRRGMPGARAPRPRRRDGDGHVRITFAFTVLYLWLGFFRRGGAHEPAPRVRPRLAAERRAQLRFGLDHLLAILASLLFVYPLSGC